MRTRVGGWILRIVVVGTALLISCGGDSGGSPTNDQGLQGDSAVRISEADLERMAPVATLSDFQRDLLSDGVLTLADYEAAYVAVVQCMEDAGWILSRELSPTLSRGHSFHAFHPVGGQQARQASEECRETYVDAVNWLWAQDHHFTETELQAARNTLGACLREAGVTGIPEHPSTGDIRAYLTSQQHRGSPIRFGDCQIRIEVEHGIADFGG